MRAGLSVMAIKTVTNTLDPRPDFFEMQIFMFIQKFTLIEKKTTLHTFISTRLNLATVKRGISANFVATGGQYFLCNPAG